MERRHFAAVIVLFACACNLVWRQIDSSFAMGSAQSAANAAPAPAWPPSPAKGRLATVAGGCFWGVELAYQRVPGVLATCPGYIGGAVKQPTYEAVCSGSTGHTEAVQMTYDPDKVTYDQLLDVLFARIDPTQVNGQGNDRGSQYRSAIFTHDDAQHAAATARCAAVPRCAVEVTRASDAPTPFWPAEAYHARYLEKGGRFGRPQSAAKGCGDPIRCYG